MLQLVRLGRTAIVLSEAARINLHDGLAVVPLSDAPRVTTVIAWPPHSTSEGCGGLGAHRDEPVKSCDRLDVADEEAQALSTSPA